MRTEYESLFWANKELVIGIDEAGRGPLAGPCVVCGVGFPIGYQNDEINDSKQLSEKKREWLSEIIRQDALEVLIEFVSEKTIDELNIYQAVKQAFTKISEMSQCQAVLTDAMKLNVDKPVTDLIKGDQKSVSIAAASIIAKTVRDHYMIKMDQLYPQYNFKSNKGYGSKEHIAALEKWGPSPIHRRSFHVHHKQLSLNL